MKLLRFSLGLTAALVLGACVSIPTGPSVLVLPGTGKSFDQFRYDDQECRDYAHVQVGGTSPSQAASDSAAKSAAAGTAVGAAAGAGGGLPVGSAAGAGAGEASAYAVQRRYDHAFVQCMYAKGHKVPVSGRLTSVPPAGSSDVPPPFPPPPPPPR